MSEEWRQIPSFPLYEASSLGRIRSPWRVRKPVLSDEGYLRVSICIGGGSVPIGVHLMVCEAFHGPKPAWAQVAAHRDGKKANNIPSNLRWSTHIQNNEDQERHGTRIWGVRHPRSVFEQFQIDRMRRMYDAAPNIKTIRWLADAYDVSELTIRKVVTRKSYVPPKSKRRSHAAP